jgi:hypothetical protein
MYELNLSAELCQHGPKLPRRKINSLFLTKKRKKTHSYQLKNKPINQLSSFPNAGLLNGIACCEK